MFWIHRIELRNRESLYSILLSMAIVSLSLSACTGHRNEVRLEKGHGKEYGLASWYGKKFHGRLTANGEVYDMYKISAAHKTLPLGTKVRVTNRRNGKSVVVRINDRGPFVRGRIIDMSYGGARALDMVAEGVVPVRVETLVLGDNRYYKSSGRKTVSATRPVRYTVQAGSFQDKRNAVDLKRELERKYSDNDVFIREWNGRAQVYYRVRVGRFSSEQDAQSLSRRLQAANYTVFVTAE
jgi:rare lipoprotein A